MNKSELNLTLRQNQSGYYEIAELTLGLLQTVAIICILNQNTSREDAIAKANKIANNCRGNSPDHYGYSSLIIERAQPTQESVEVPVRNRIHFLGLSF